MDAFERPQVARLIERLTDDKAPPLIVAVTGPRQSGKTTIVQQALRKVARLGLRGRYVALDDPEARRQTSVSATEGAVAIPPSPHDTDWLVSVWRRARHHAATSDRGFVLVLDEIQYVENWSTTVKGLWDADRRAGVPLRVVILGSAPWHLLTGMGESLAGRFMPLSVRHWSLSEMAEAFDYSLQEYLFYGGYPGAAPFTSGPGEWRSYIAHSILAPIFERDLLARTRVQRPSVMRQLVDVAPEYSGQIVKPEHLAGRLRGAGSARTIAHYVNLLADAGIMTGLPNYSGSAVGRASSNPKLIVLNSSLMTARSGYSFEEARSDRTFWGRIVETAVGAHLHNTLETSMHLAYWRDGHHEVDYVLFQGPHVLGIEVKSRRWRGSLPGLTAFGKRFPRAGTLLVGGRDGIPLNEFLYRPAGQWLRERS